MTQENNIIKAYTDGSCKGNPGPGGWGVLIQQVGKQDIELHGGEEATTNNRMELQAAFQAGTRVVPLLNDNTSAIIITDSQYVKKGITEWIRNWKRNGWKTAAGKPVKNADLWKQLDDLMMQANQGGGERLTWRWVKGHSGHPGNEHADSLANIGVAEVMRGGAVVQEIGDTGSTPMSPCIATKEAVTTTGKAVQLPLSLLQTVTLHDVLRLVVDSPDFKGMPTTRLLLLLTIASKPGIEQKALGEILGMSESALSRNCNALGGRGYKQNGNTVGGKGWIVLVRLKSDYRKQTAYLTEEGRRVVERIRPGAVVS